MGSGENQLQCYAWRVFKPTTRPMEGHSLRLFAFSAVSAGTLSMSQILHKSKGFFIHPLSLFVLFISESESESTCSAYVPTKDMLTEEESRVEER